MRIISLRVGSRRRAQVCGHHWHVTETGWCCCGCPRRQRGSAAAPSPGTAVCARPGEDEQSIRQWLAPPARSGRLR